MSKRGEKKFPVRMTPKDWKESYKGKLPHWAVSLEPSPLARQFLRTLPKKKCNRILEIGIGNGRDSIYFFQKGNNVSGIDIASGAVKMAKKNAKRTGCKGIDFSVGNAEKLKFKNGEFDAVYSVSVLHSTNLKKSISEISRVLKTKGRAIIYFYEFTESNGKKYNFYSREETEKIILRNGLVIDKIRVSWDKDKHHPKEKTKILIFKMRKTAVGISS